FFPNGTPTPNCTSTLCAKADPPKATPPIMPIIRTENSTRLLVRITVSFVRLASYFAHELCFILGARRFCCGWLHKRHCPVRSDFTPGSQPPVDRSRRVTISAPGHSGRHSAMNLKKYFVPEIVLQRAAAVDLLGLRLVTQVEIFLAVLGNFEIPAGPTLHWRQYTHAPTQSGRPRTRTSYRCGRRN